MKKKLLFVIESLACAGAEKSLVTLLNLIDYSKYDVDLQLFTYGGEFEDMLPEYVNMLPQMEYFQFCSKPLKECLTNINAKKIRMLCGRLAYSIAIRMGNYDTSQEAVLFWKSANKNFATLGREYDIAIAYAQGVPTFFVADCVTAKRKYAWINAVYRPKNSFRAFVLKKYQAFEKISSVSNVAYNTFCEVFCEIEKKGLIIKDINDGNAIKKMSKLQQAPEMIFSNWKLLSIGRLASEKGYDIALEACKCLKDRGIQFKWYALGRGPLESEIRKKIVEYGIEDQFVLLGTRKNPYPYIQEADIYVQTSRFEGFGLAIAEARMLNTPVVTTRFDAVYAQMVDGENGLVVDMNGGAVADGIQRLMEDQQLYDHIVDYQSQEKKGNYEELEKFYALIES